MSRREWARGHIMTNDRFDRLDHDVRIRMGLKAGDNADKIYETMPQRVAEVDK